MLTSSCGWKSHRRLSRAQLVRQPIDAGTVDLDQVPGRVAHVELDEVARQLDEAVAERRVVERVMAFGGTVGGLDVVDRDREVVVAGRLEVALEQWSCVRPSASHWTGKPKLGVSIGSAPSRST